LRREFEFHLIEILSLSTTGKSKFRRFSRNSLFFSLLAGNLTRRPVRR
jgi:hypothetical protein